MTSSMLSGERRWHSSSTRRGGMTVLGKVAVPKPINLPSQRLENHGLDPSVEIVPKGTHSWGSRSSSTSNAWGSSTLSPRTDGGSGSPSLLSGRPSSGGSGTRPSTASSDRAHEPSVNNAWGQNSRPSSASGTLTSNQTSLTSLRPRSADNRPGSSHLSRFAEQLPENPGAWGAVGTSERLGVSAPKHDGFSLTSGDFPTLGSEKDNSGKSTDAQDSGSHSRPNSSSGGVAPLKERSETYITDAKSGITNSWRRDNPPYSTDVVTSSLEKWQADPQPYPNANIPHHFEAYHGPPVTNPPSGVWFRGPPSGPPYGPPVGPGGFPIEPFPYYRPQMPPTALASQQPGPPPGGGPRGHHPSNGDLYRPHIPDSYIRPGMPIRPGFYPGPVAYEGYYGGPMGYCNSNERDGPFMGMVAGPSIYNRFSTQNVPEPNSSLGRSGGYGSSGKTMVPEHVESGHPHDTRGPYKVLLKQQNDWDGKIEEKKWEGTKATNAAYVEKGNRPGMSSWENDWSSDYGNDEGMDLRGTVPSQEISSQPYDNQRSSSVPVKAKSPESVGNTKADISARKLESASTGLPEVTGSVSSVPNESTLIKKIEGLNAKARASDKQHNITSIPSGEEQKEQKNISQVHNAKANHSADEGGRGFVYTERIHASEITNPASREMGASVGDKSLESTAASRTTISRKSIHDMQGRGGNRGQKGHNSQEVDGWLKKSRVIDSPSLVSASWLETNSNGVHVHEHHTSVQASEKSASEPRAKDDRESTPVFDPSDHQAQRSKLRELEQRAKQLREEEEERTRKQMAKAHAKLEELDRRKHSMEGPTQNAENASSDAIDNKQELNAVPPTGEGTASRVEQFPVLSCELSQEKPKSVNKESKVHGQSVSLHQNADSADVAYGNNASHVHDGNASKQKRMGYKQKQNLEKNSNVKLISPGTNEALKHHTDAGDKVTVSVGRVANETTLSCKSSLPVKSNSVAESSSLAVNATAVVESLPQRKKNNRGGKNKHKVEAAASMATLPSSESKETNLVNASPECDKPNVSDAKLDLNLVQAVTMSKDENLLLEQCSSLPTEDSHGRVNNSQSKSQHSRRMSRNPQANRSADKFHGDVMWAPVASHNKADADEASQKNVVEVISPSMKRDHEVHGNPKYKRAEIERYVPKPAAKEMAQQGSIQQLVASSINQTTSDEKVGRADYSSPGTESSQPAGSAIVKVGVGLDSQNGDGRQNKQQGKSHGSWRQRGSAEFGVQSTQDGPSSYPTRNVQKSVEHYQSQLPDVDSVEEQQKYSDERNAPDGWNISDNSESVAPVAVTVVKDQRVAGRGKRHPFKGQKGMGNNNDLDQKKISGGETGKIDTQTSSIEMSQTHLPTSTENRGIGERTTAHWQPKSQAFAANYQQGSRSSSSRGGGAGVLWTNKKESTRQGAVPQTNLHDNRTGGLSEPHHRDHDQSPSKNVDGEEPLDVGYQEAKRGRRVGPLRGRPHSPNEILVSPAEQAPETLDVRHEQRSSSGHRKSGHHNNNRVGRGHETRGDWNSSGQDSKHHNPPVNWERERQRQTSHFEYQPVASYNHNKSNSGEGPKDVAHNTGPRFKERSQNQSRRGGGNSYGRQGGNNRVDAEYQ